MLSVFDEIERPIDATHLAGVQQRDWVAAKQLIEAVESLMEHEHPTACEEDGRRVKVDDIDAMAVLWERMQQIERTGGRWGRFIAAFDGVFQGQWCDGRRECRKFSNGGGEWRSG